jgi:hypothetical protein
MLHYVVWHILIHVLEELAASIIRAIIAFTMEALSSFETPVSIYQD